MKKCEINKKRNERNVTMFEFEDNLSTGFHDVFLSKYSVSRIKSNSCTLNYKYAFVAKLFIFWYDNETQLKKEQKRNNWFNTIKWTLEGNLSCCEHTIFATTKKIKRFAFLQQIPCHSIFFDLFFFWCFSSSFQTCFNNS